MIRQKAYHLLQIQLPHQDGLVVSMSPSHEVGREFTPRLGHSKDHHKNCTNCLQALGKCLAMQPDCVKTKGLECVLNSLRDMHYKDHLGLSVRVGYCIPVQDFYLELHELRNRMSTLMDK